MLTENTSAIPSGMDSTHVASEVHGDGVANQRGKSPSHPLRGSRLNFSRPAAPSETVRYLRARATTSHRWRDEWRHR